MKGLCFAADTGMMLLEHLKESQHIINLCVRGYVCMCVYMCVHVCTCVTVCVYVCVCV